MDVVQRSAMTEADVKKVNELLKRPYINNLQLRRELNYFLNRRLKCEIENVYTYIIEHFINDYIPRKIRLIEMPPMPLSM